MVLNICCCFIYMNTMLLLLLLLPQGNTVLLFQSFELFFVQYLFSITTTSIYRVDTVAQTQSLPVWSNRVVGIDRGVFLLIFIGTNLTTLLVLQQKYQILYL